MSLTGNPGAIKTVMTTKTAQEELRRVVRCLLKAGEKARQRYANREAVTFYQRGLSIIPNLEDEDWEQLAEFYEGLGDAQHLIGEFDSALEFLERAFSIYAGHDTDEARKHFII